MTLTDNANEAAADPEKRIVWLILIAAVAVLAVVAIKFR